MANHRSSASQSTPNYWRSRLSLLMVNYFFNYTLINVGSIRYHFITRLYSFTHSLLFINLIMQIILLNLSPAEALLIKGSAIRCTNEGDRMEVSIVFNDPCIECRCSNQVIVCKKAKCYFERCKKEVKCKPGQRISYRNSCPICVDMNGYCRVQGQPFSVTNFDSNTINYDGVFNHILTRDCKAKEFSIHLLKRFDPDLFRYNLSSSLMTSSFNAIVVRLKKIKVRLTRYNVKIGRQTVKLPYTRPGLTIVRHDTKIALRASNGIKLTWDGLNGIQVAVPMRFRRRTCGLCGNFNGDSSDDFRTKKGLLTPDVNRFFKSWKLRIRSGWG